MRLGYARPSVADPSMSLQRTRLNEFECDVIFLDDCASAAATQSALERQVLRMLRKGDVLVVTSLDRFGLRLSRLLHTLVWLHARGVRLICISEEIDSASESWVHQLSLAKQFTHTERVLHHESTRRGVIRAMSNGRVPGRPSKLSDAAVNNARNLLEMGHSPSEVASTLHISVATLYRYVPAAASL